MTVVCHVDGCQGNLEKLSVDPLYHHREILFAVLCYLDILNFWWLSDIFFFCRYENLSNRLEMEPWQLSLECDLAKMALLSFWKYRNSILNCSKER
jgi:hypothetical protein